MAETKLAEKPLFTNQQLMTLIWPLLVEQFLAVMVGMADTMMVSRAGEAAISGVSLVDMINQLIINLFAALATGGAVVVSQYLGARHRKDAEDAGGQLVVLSGLLGLAVGGLCLLAAGPIVRLVYGALEQDVFDACCTYLRITAISYPLLALYNAGAALFRSMGNSRISMRVSILMNVINVIGNAILVFGFNMGVAGVAWPSVISRGVAAVLILRAAAAPENPLCLHTGSMRRIDGPLARRILHIGIPSAFENSLFQAGRILVVAIITGFGTVQISANAVANNLDGVSVIPGQAIGLAMIAVVGRAVGARDERQAIGYTKKLLAWSYVAMVLSAGSVLLFLKPMLGLYAISSDTYELAALLIRIHAGCGMLIWPLAFVLPNALRAAGDVNFTMISSVVSMVVWRLGFSYILAVQMNWGAFGVWVAMVIDWVCRTLCFVGRFASGAWKTKYRPD